MTTGYTKLFASIVHSTIWREPDHVRLVWVTMLALSDRYGEVSASVPGLADAARVTVEQCEAALEKLASPDPYSRTKAHEGRRIEPCPGGWALLNHALYREKMSADEQRHKARERQRRKRAKDKEAVTAGVTAGHDKSRGVTAGHDKHKQKQKQQTPDVRQVFEHWQASTGHLRAKLDKKRAARIGARLAEGHTVDDLCAAISNRKHDAWLMGTDPKSPRVFDGLETLLRDSAQVERLRDIEPPKLDANAIPLSRTQAEHDAEVERSNASVMAFLESKRG